MIDPRQNVQSALRHHATSNAHIEASLCQVVRRTCFEERIDESVVVTVSLARVGSGPGVASPKSRRFGV